jgi:glycine cleavage system aminomethyltransferase T
VDYAWLRGNLAEGVTLEPVEDRALIALQGPKAAEVMARTTPAQKPRGAARTRLIGILGASVMGTRLLRRRSRYMGPEGA